MLKPLYNRIVIRQHEGDEKTTGGLIIPETVRDRPRRGTVVAIGPGELRPDGTLKPIATLEIGDEVLYSKYGNTGIKDPETGEDMVIIDNKTILAITKKRADCLACGMG